jgi:hypothetical protein
MLGAALIVFPQIQQSTPQNPTQNADQIKTEEAKLYADAHPYLDEPLPKLKKTVHELGELEPSASQDQLTDLLAKVAAKADDLLRKVPNLISDEAVSETEMTVPKGEPLGCIGAGCSQFAMGHHSQRNQKFSYIILAHTNQYGQLQLEEYRTGRNDKPVPQGTAAPKFQGFVANWLVFSSSNQGESRFRYLGQQNMDGHNSFVIGFAQIPGAIEYPGQFLTAKGSIPMLLQGVAWIDQSDFRIIRLRTDLLAPQPQVEFQEQTSNIGFGPVKLADTELWLPEAVDVEMEADGQYLQEQHQYSNYRLYQAKSRIVLSPQ